MTTKDKFEYNCFGKTYTCQFAIGEYGNGNLALEIMGAEGTNYEGEPIARVTVNPGERVDDGRIAIKDYSENEGMVDTLLEMGIIKGDPLYTIPSGWVQIPVYELTDKGLALWGLERLSAK
jgi:hypothetical protein